MFIKKFKVTGITFVLVFALLFSSIVLFNQSFAATFGDGTSLPGEISENSSITGKVKQNSTAKIGAGKTLTIKDGGVLELGADAACVNFLLENGGTLVIEKGGQLILDYTSDTVVHEAGVIKNYGTITNKGSFTLDGATVYNYGTFDNQLWINLNGGAKIYSTVPIQGVNNIQPLDPDSEVSPPIDAGSGNNSGVVINVDPSTGDTTSSTGGAVTDGTTDSGIDTPSNTDGSGGDNSPDLGGSGGGITAPTDSGVSDSSNTDGSAGGITTPTDSGVDDPSNTGSSVGDNSSSNGDSGGDTSNSGSGGDSSNPTKNSPTDTNNNTPVNVINNIPDNIDVIGVDTNNSGVIQITNNPTDSHQDSVKNLNIIIPGKKDGQKNSYTFYVKPNDNLKKGTHKTDLLVQYKAPSSNGKVTSTLAVPVKVLVGVKDKSASVSTGNIGWALLNLILMILTILLAIIAIIWTAMKRKSRNLISLLTIPVAIVSAILFFLNENIKTIMMIQDNWTGWMAALFVLGLLIFTLAREKKHTFAN